MRTKVLHIIKSLGRGGAEMLLPETLKLHNKEKFEFHYIYFLPWKDQMVSAIKQAGGEVTCLEATNNIKIIQKAGEIIRYCSEHNIDMIHCHLPWAGFVGRLVHKRIGIPVIYTEHNKQERYHRITFTLNKLSFNYQTKAIAVSNDVAESIQRNINTSTPVEVVLNGVNTTRFKRNPEAGSDLRARLGIDSGGPVIGTIAVFRFQKRLIEWLNVFSEIRKSVPELRGIIVGDGPLKGEILAERSRLGLDDAVIMPGLEEEVRPYLSAMDVYLMTSSFEGLPIALLEAMSMECAIVSTKAGGIAELVEQGKSGLLREVEDWQSLKEDILTLLHDESTKNALSQEARRRVSGAFSMRRMVNQLEDCYIETVT